MNNRIRSKMVKLLLVVTGITLAASLVAFFVTLQVPYQVKRVEPVVSYQQQGQFDYSISLKPSYLFGPDPEKPLPNPRYPAKIVSTMDFSYSFTPGPASASAELIMENPGLWQKSIVLSQPKPVGSQSLDFSVDVQALEAQFVSIEDEVETASNPRQATIKVTVNSANQTFSQSLPLHLTDTVVEVEDSLVEEAPGGTGILRYWVNLRSNSIFSVDKIASPGAVPARPQATVKPGQPVFTRLADNMSGNFDYRFTSDKPLTGVTSDVALTTTLEAAKLWTKEFTLYRGVKEGNFNIAFPVDIGSYFALLDTVKNETGAPAAAYSLKVTATVNTIARTAGGTVVKTFTQTLNGTIKDNVLQFDADFGRKDPGAITRTTLVPNEGTYLGMTPATLKIAVPILLIACIAFFTVYLVAFLRSKPALISATDREVGRIGRKYGPRMAEGNSRGPATVELASMEDLARVAEELGKPILHETTDVNGSAHMYFVVDGFTIYRFRLGATQEMPVQPSGSPESSGS